YKVLFDMKNDINDLKKLTLELLQHGSSDTVKSENSGLIQKIYGDDPDEDTQEYSTEERLQILQIPEGQHPPREEEVSKKDKYHYAEDIEEEETLSLQEKEIELIKKALDRNNGKRKAAAEELGISERTLYRKIKLYDL